MHVGLNQWTHARSIKRFDQHRPTSSLWCAVEALIHHCGAFKSVYVVSVALSTISISQYRRETELSRMTECITSTKKAMKNSDFHDKYTEIDLMPFVLQEIFIQSMLTDILLVQGEERRCALH